MLRGVRPGRPRPSACHEFIAVSIASACVAAKVVEAKRFSSGTELSELQEATREKKSLPPAPAARSQHEWVAARAGGAVGEAL